MEWRSNTAKDVARRIAERLIALLAEQPVTWLVSGGSNVAVQAHVMLLLARSGNLERLSVMLIDERFGTVGHADSNWQQLEEAGFMIPGPTYVPPFTAMEKTLEHAATRYEAILGAAIKDESYLFALLGMGEDGHVAGILPGSVAAHEMLRLVAGYSAPPHQRLTATFAFLRQLDEVVLVAYGKNKWPQLEKLGHAVDPDKQPVQIIKDVGRVTIYTDDARIDNKPAGIPTINEG